MKRLADLRARMGYGPMDFWREFGEAIRDRRENFGREWLTYDEYRVIFRRAHKAGLFAVYADEKGEPTARFHSPLGMALLRLYRAVKSAKQRGIPEQQFHAEFCAQVDAETDVVRKAVAYRDERAREAREKVEQDRRRAPERRRPVVDDQEITEVRVGYQAPAERQAS